MAAYEMELPNSSNNNNEAHDNDFSTSCEESFLDFLSLIEQSNLRKVEEILSSNDDALNLVNKICGGLHITALQVASNLSDSNGPPLVHALLQRGANVNAADKLGRTALHYASINGNEEIVRLLLATGADPNACFKVISWPKFLNPRRSAVGSTLPLPDCWGRTPLHCAVKSGHGACVEALLLAGALVEATDERGITPLLLAGAAFVSVDDNTKATAEYERIVNALIKAGVEVNVYNADMGTTALHQAASIGSAKVTETLVQAGAKMRAGSCGVTPLHEAAGSGNVEVCKQLLKCADAAQYVNMADSVGRTPLHKAAYGGRRCALDLLLQHGGDLSAETYSKASVVELVLSHIPRPVHFLMEHLDQKVKHNNVSVNDLNFKINLDFNVLSPRGPVRQMAVVAGMVAAGNDEQRSKLLQHPLIEAYLRIKWKRLRGFFFLLVALHSCFVAAFSVYAMLLVNTSRRSHFVMDISRYVLVGSGSLLLGHGVVQCILVPRHYYRQYEMWFNLLCALLSVAVGFSGNHDREDSPPAWVLHAVSLGVLLAWGELMLLMGRFPKWGYYALMFSRVLQNVVKVLMTFVCLVIGFALSFTVQFRTSVHFSDPWRALVKTTVMMMGEFEYTDMFGDDINDPLRLPVTSRVVFLMFIVLASIVLMNLMVGLAVSDIQGLQTEGHVTLLIKQVHFLFELEKVISHPVLKFKCFPKKLHKILNDMGSIPTCMKLYPGRAICKDGRDVICASALSISLLESLAALAIKNYAKNAKEKTLSESAAQMDSESTSILELMKFIQIQLSDIQQTMCRNNSINNETVFDGPGDNHNISV